MTTTTSQIISSKKELIYLAFEIHNLDEDYDAPYMEDDYAIVNCYKQVKDLVNNWSCPHFEHAHFTDDDDPCHIEYIHDTSGGTIYNYFGETEKIDNCPCVDCNKDLK